jgi:hypothetical protein
MTKIIKTLGFIPRNLDLNEHLKMYPPLNIPYFKKDKLIELISILYSDGKCKYYQNGFVCLSSTYLYKLVRTPYAYIKYLIDTGIIECDFKAIKGEKAFGYRLLSKYAKELPIAHVIKSNAKAKTKYKNIDKWINGIGIDSIKAWSEIKDYDYRKRNAELIKIVKILSKQFSATVDGTSFRYHSNLTNLKKEVRHHLNWRGQQLVNVDITNSQPYISTALFSESNLVLSSFNPVLTNKYLHTLLTSDSYILVIQSGGDDVKKYVNLCVSGFLYQYLEEKANDTFSIKFVNRKAVKVSVFSILYSDNRYMNNMKILFSELFPTVYKIFSLIKKKRKNALAVLLQSLESNLILNRICKRISNERPDVPLLPIHDSISTTVGNEYYVANVMTDELSKHIGHKPKLTFEYYYKPNGNHNQKVDWYSIAI